MFTHGPSCLEGPKMRAAGRWAKPRTPRASLREQAAGSRDGDVRIDLVLRVRREIAEGRYETPAKWEAALDRLFATLDGE